MKMEYIEDQNITKLSSFDRYELQKEFDNIFYLFKENLNKNTSSFSHEEEKQKEKLISKIIKENSSHQYQQRIFLELCGYGPLESLIHQTHLNEIIVNDRRNIIYEQNGVIKYHLDSFLSNITFKNIVERLSIESKIVVNLKKPFAEGKWKDFRIHITRPPLVKKDFHIILRKHPKNKWTLEKLQKNDWASSEAFPILKKIIHEKLNFLIVGPTSSGKTSVLNACLNEIPQNERVIIIEDADEIQLPNKASLKLLTQTSPESSLPVIRQEDLVKQSLRLRPDRIVMGEVRGEESKDLLLALASGHHGSIGTLHAKNHKQALWKLETLTQMGAPQWNHSTIQRLIHSGLQIIVVLEKIGNSKVLKGIYEITSHEKTTFLFKTLFSRKFYEN